jgi:hypothetical protein
MTTTKRKQLQRKQLKRTYRIPRSLKKSIKKTLVEIVRGVKQRERKIRDEEVSFLFVKHIAYLSMTVLCFRFAVGRFAGIVLTFVL